MQGGYFPGSRAPQEFRVHTEKNMSLTLLRSIRSRGRGMECSSRNEDALRDRCQRLLLLFNGDIRQHGAVHYCSNCCSGPQEAARKMCDLLVEVFDNDIPATIPSNSKWWTRHPQLKQHS